MNPRSTVSGATSSYSDSSGNTGGSSRVRALMVGRRTWRGKSGRPKKREPDRTPINSICRCEQETVVRPGFPATYILDDEDGDPPKLGGGPCARPDGAC